MGLSNPVPALLRRQHLSIVVAMACAQVHAEQPVRVAQATPAQTTPAQAVKGTGKEVGKETPVQLAQAQPGTLSEVVVSATRAEQDVLDVVNTVTTISAQRIEKEMPTDLKGMLRNEAGVSVRVEPNRSSAVFRATGRSGNEGVNIRGLEGDQVLLQVDGVRLPGTYTSGPYSAGRGNYIDVEAFKRVEILRGPSSTQFGSDGLAGAVAFLTKDPSDLLTLGKPFQVAIKMGYSSADKSMTTVPSVAYAGDTFEAMFLASLRQGSELGNQGENYSSNVNRTAPNPQDVRSRYYLGKFVIKPNAHHQFKFTAEQLDRRVDTDVLTFFGDPFAVATLTNVDAREDIMRRLFKLDYTYTDSSNPWFQRAQASFYRQNSENKQWGLENRSVQPLTRWRDTTYAESVMGGNVQFESNFGDAVTHRLVYGVDASATDVTSMKDGFNSAAPAFVPNKSFPDTDYRLLGAFIQDEIRVGQWSIIPGLRYDSFKLTPRPDALYRINNATVPSALNGSELSPKLGVIWRLNPMVNLFAQYAHGFRAPTPSQVNGGVTNLTSADPYTSIGNPNLKPETSDSFELGVRGRSDTRRYSASAFRGKYRNFIASNVLVQSNPAPTPDVFQSMNLNNVEIRGFELRGEWAFRPNWSASAAYAYSKGDSRQNNAASVPLDTIDPSKLVLALRYDKANRYGAQLTVTTVERKRRNPSPATRYTPGGFSVVDLTGFYHIDKNLSVQAGIFNVFDRKYFLWADVRNLAPNYAQLDSYSQPGRNASVSLKYQF